MKKRISISLLLYLLLFTGLISSCSKDNEILASSKLMDFTKKDFYSWLDAKKINKEPILNSKKTQKQFLTSMALEYFIMDRAKEEGFDKSKNMMRMKLRLKESVLNTHFKNTISENATYNAPAVKVSNIFLKLDLFKQNPDDKSRRIRLDPPEVAKKNDEILQKAKDIIKRLDEGESFARLAADFSEHSSNKNGGDIGFITKDMMPAYFSRPAFALNKGEYTKTPVMTPKGVYIIKVTDRVDLTEKNIDNIIEDQNQRNRIKSFLLLRYINEYYASLDKADDVEYIYKKDKPHNSTNILFRIGSKEYTLADLDKYMEKRMSGDKFEKAYTNGKITDKFRPMLVENYFKNLLRSREAERLEVEKKPEYLKEFKEKEINMVMGEYFEARLSNNVLISDQEILEEYEKGKKTKYFERVLENDSLVNKPKPLDLVKGEIIDELKKETLQKKAKAQRQKILDLYEFKIDETALQGS